MITPIRDKVAVISLKSDKKTETGIILTGDVNSDTKKAKVIAIGPEVTDVAVNDVLLINWDKTAVTKLMDIPVYVLKQEDIIAVIEPES